MGARRGSLATAGAVALAAICCAGPAAVGALAGAGAWLAGHGAMVAAGSLVTLAAGVALAWIVVRDRQARVRQAKP